MKRSGRDEPIQVAIHMCMEATLGISLYTYLYLKLAKTLCFSYYFLWFLFNKIGEQEGRTGSAHSWEVAQTLYIHVSKCKNDEKKDNVALKYANLRRVQSLKYYRNEICI
jgi:hypothetical protein